MSEYLGFLKAIHLSGKSILKSIKTSVPYFIGLGDQQKEITEEYPDRVSARMPEDLPARFRGILKNDINKCSGCRACVDICPVSCIRIETEPGPEKAKSWVSVFDIDISKCTVCGLCAEACPTGSLTHSNEYEGSVYHQQQQIVSCGKGWATSEMKERWRQEQETKDLQEKERAKAQQSPLGSEFKKLLSDKKE